MGVRVHHHLPLHHISDGHGGPVGRERWFDEARYAAGVEEAGGAPGAGAGGAPGS